MILQRRKPLVFTSALHAFSKDIYIQVNQIQLNISVSIWSSVISLPPRLNKPQSLKRKLVKRAVRDVWSVMKSKRLLDDLPNIIPG